MSMPKEAVQKQIKIYITVFVILSILTVVTVAISYLDLSTPMAILIALAVATVKGSLVACYFMHLISEKIIISSILILTAIFFLVLLTFPAFV